MKKINCISLLLLCLFCVSAAAQDVGYQPENDPKNTINSETDREAVVVNEDGKIINEDGSHSSCAKDCDTDNVSVVGRNANTNPPTDASVSEDTSGTQ